MIETHPFELFCPTSARFLILGSFTAKRYEGDTSYDWYYGSRRNKFWTILEKVYKVELKDRKAKQKLLGNLKIAIGDIIYQCERKKGNSLDSNLINIIYNKSAISTVLSGNNIKRIYFSSRFVEDKFKKNFKELISKYPEVELVTLPSPSPRFALMTLSQKVARYNKLLPRL